MNLKTVQKFDKLIQKTSNKKLNTFDEITDIVINLMKMQSSANHNELMERVSKSANFASIDEMQDFLKGYFEFHNALVAEFESMEDLDDDVFDKKIVAFTKAVTSVIPQDEFQEHIRKFLDSVIRNLIQEYPLEESLKSGIDIVGLAKIFGDKEIAFIFAKIVTTANEIEEKELDCEELDAISSYSFTLCMGMNSLRKHNCFNAGENTTMQNAVNSPSYNVGRNDPCPCGSGRKYKKCCLDKDKPKPLESIKFEEPKDVLPALTKEEMHEFYTIWSQFLNFVSAAYAGASESEYIKIYDKKSNGDYYLTDEAMRESHYITIRNFLAEYFFMLVDHFIDDNHVSKKNQQILFELRESYKDLDVFYFEMFKNGNAIFYNPDDKTPFYVHKTYFDYSQVYPKAKLLQTMFFSYKGRIITDGIAASPKVEMGENMQNMIKKEYEQERKNLVFALAKNEKPSKNIYQLKISIKGAKPPIWRRVFVDQESSFEELHNIIQNIFNWRDYHLYAFEGKRAIYVNREEVEENMYSHKEEVPSDIYSLEAELKNEKDKIVYTYDFGDDWEHEIVLEKILPKDENVSYPLCTAGRRAGPIEDSGGIYNYLQIVASIENPTQENRCFLGEDGENWYEGFVPSHFDKDYINRKLRSSLNG